MMEMKLFYNPIWMQSNISIFCCEIPEQLEIDSYDHELYLRDHYKRLSNEAFKMHGEKIYQWYGEFIDENYWYDDPNTLIDCLMESDKFSFQSSGLKDRIEENKIPDYVIRTNEAQSLYEDMDLYNLFYLLDKLFFKHNPPYCLSLKLLFALKL